MARRTMRRHTAAWLGVVLGGAMALAGCMHAVHAPAAIAPGAAAESLAFGGLMHQAIGGAGLARDGARLRVVGLGGSGADGVHVRLPAGVTALRVHARVADESRLVPGAWLQVSSCGIGGVTDSIGFLRITRVAAGGYEVSGGLNGMPAQDVVAMRGGREVHREPVPAVGDAFARVPACLACGSNLNDAVTTVAGRASALVLRWQWSRALPVALLRPGAPDTAVVADELRLVARVHGNVPVALSELDVRGRDLGEIVIDRETATRDR